MTVVDDVRDWVGSTPDADAVAAALARFDDYTDGTAAWRAALSILRVRRADALGPSFSVAGDYSEDPGGYVKSLDVRIADLQRLIGDDEAPLSGLPPLASTPICAPRTGR